MTRRLFGVGVLTGLAGATAASAQSEEAKLPPNGADVDNAEISSDLITPDVKRVGVRLRCLCGCAMTVGECNMVGCHYASPARVRIHEMLKSGMTDDEIVAAFVKEEGPRALAAPPATGFNWFGYSAPYLLAAVGAVFVAFVIKRLKSQPVPKPLPPVEPRVLDKYEAAAAKDIADLED